MRYIVNYSISFILFLSISCVAVPKQAPVLSEELGSKIKLIQDSHLTLVENYFDEKRKDIDEYVNKVWLPTFANELFQLEEIQVAWTKVVNSDNSTDKVKFLTIVGPEILKKINEKRLELITPLNELEKEVKSKINLEYDIAYSINNTLTSFLYSASKVDANRERYLDKLGITDEKIDSAVESTSKAVQDLVKVGTKVQEGETKVNSFLQKIEEIKKNLKAK